MLRSHPAKAGYHRSMTRSYLWGLSALLVTLGSAGCLRDPCDPDPFERDEGDTDGTDLGSLTDSPSTNQVFEMTLDRPDDVDQFHFDMLDQSGDGTPEIEIWVRPQEDEQLDLEIDYRCRSGVMSQFECNGETRPSVKNGNAGMVCRTAARGELYLDISNYHCDGNTEDEGYAVVTVTRQNAPAACAAYDIEIDTD